MTTFATVTFVVPPTGAGRTDYSALVTETIQQVLNLNYPESSVAANIFDDYAEINLTSGVTAYVVGTNANIRRAGSWDSGAPAKSVAFYSQVDLLVKFNYTDAVEHEIPANILKTMTRRVSTIYIRAKDRAGSVKIWIEG